MAERVGRLTLPDPDPLLSKLKVRGEPREVAGRVCMGQMGTECGQDN